MKGEFAKQKSGRRPKSQDETGQRNRRNLGKLLDLKRNLKQSNFNKLYMRTGTVELFGLFSHDKGNRISNFKKEISIGKRKTKISFPLFAI